MKPIAKLLISLVWFQYAALCAGQSPDDSVAVVIFQTEHGEIETLLYLNKAPITCANFLSYVELAGEAGGTFYRTVTLDNQPDKNIKTSYILERV